MLCNSSSLTSAEIRPRSSCSSASTASLPMKRSIDQTAAEIAARDARKATPQTEIIECLVSVTGGAPNKMKRRIEAQSSL
jgi:hypothetical protein